MSGNRREKESRDLLDMLGGPRISPLVGRTPDRNERPSSGSDDLELRGRLHDRRVANAGRPAAGTVNLPDLDSFTVYNFKIRRSKLESLKRVGLVETRLMRELLEEAVDDFLEKHKKSLV